MVSNVPRVIKVTVEKQKEYPRVILKGCVLFKGGVLSSVLYGTYSGSVSRAQVRVGSGCKNVCLYVDQCSIPKSSTYLFEQMKGFLSNKR